MTILYLHHPAGRWFGFNPASDQLRRAATFDLELADHLRGPAPIEAAQGRRKNSTSTNPTTSGRYAIARRATAACPSEMSWSSAKPPAPPRHWHGNPSCQRTVAATIAADPNHSAESGHRRPGPLPHHSVGSSDPSSAAATAAASQPSRTASRSATARSRRARRPLSPWRIGTRPPPRPARAIITMLSR